MKIDPKQLRALIYVLFFISGVSGLVYEIIWVRMLAITFGAGAFAIAAVLSSFMGGLALGSYFTGRVVDKIGKPLRIYGVLEIFIGVYGVLFPLLLVGVQAIYSASYGLGNEPGPAPALHFLRFILAILILVPPTFAMGGTLPSIIVALRNAGAQPDRSFSLAYGLNTLGATLGVVIAGFWLMWTLGVQISLFSVASINIIVGIFAILISRLSAQTQTVPGENGIAFREETTSFQMFKLIAVAFIAGAAALGAQVLWTRALSMVLGSAVYAFASILTVILIGVGVGAIIHRLLPKRFAGSNLLILILLATSATGFGTSVYLLQQAPLIFLWGFSKLGETFAAVQVFTFVIVFIILFIPSLANGMILPALLARYRTNSTGERVGRLYAGNTFGAIAGSLLGTFLIMPTVGTIDGIRLFAILLIAVGAILLSQKKETFIYVPVGIALAVFCWLVPGADESRLNLGVAASPGGYINYDGSISLEDNNEELLYYNESVDSTFSVISYADVLILKVNGKSVASTNYDDLRVEEALGNLPALANGSPRRGLVIGLGTGITLGALVDYPGVDEIICVEINPDIAKATEFFAAYNGDPINNPKVTLIHEDGRSFALCSDEKFDVITSDPIHPWTKGSAGLYTVEHFSNCSEMLNDGGVMAQWMPLYQLSPQDYSMCVASFANAFEHTALVFTGTDTVLLGRDKPFDEGIIGSPYLIALDGEVLESFGEYGVNVEDKLVLEYNAPRSLYEYNQDKILQMLIDAQDAPSGSLEDVVKNIMVAKKYSYLGDIEKAEIAAEKAYALGGNDWQNNDINELNSDIAFEQAWWASENGDYKLAIAYYEKVLYYNPKSIPAKNNLAILRSVYGGG